jgi:hypothetical protein
MPAFLTPLGLACRTLAPEQRVVVAIFHRALADTRSRHAEVRQDALAFLHDEAALAFWDDLVGLDGALQQQVRRTLRHGR